jgi:hypothetical protein
VQRLVRLAVQQAALLPGAQTAGVDEALTQETSRVSAWAEAARLRNHGAPAIPSTHTARAARRRRLCQPHQSRSGSSRRHHPRSLRRPLLLAPQPPGALQTPHATALRISTAAAAIRAQRWRRRSAAAALDRRGTLLSAQTRARRCAVPPAGGAAREAWRAEASAPAHCVPRPEAQRGADAGRACGACSKHCCERLRCFWRVNRLRRGEPDAETVIS